MRRNQLTDNDNMTSDFYDVLDMADHGQPATRVPLAMMRKNEVQKGLLLIVRLQLSPSFQAIRLVDESTYMIALKAVALVGGFGLVAWLFFQKLSQGYQNHYFHMNLIRDLMRVAPKIKQKKVSTQRCSDRQLGQPSSPQKYQLRISVESVDLVRVSASARGSAAPGAALLGGPFGPAFMTLTSACT